MIKEKYCIYALLTSPPEEDTPQVPPGTIKAEGEFADISGVQLEKKKKG